MSLKYYILDVETNGLSSTKHEITQISIIRYDDRKQLTKWIKIQHPEYTDQRALIATNRTYKDLFFGETKENVVKACNDFIQSDGLTNEHRCFVGHNAINFDRRFCHALWSSVNSIFPGNIWFNSIILAKQWAKKLGIEAPKLTLAACLEFTGLKPIDSVSHEAAADARNTYLLFKKGMEEGLDHLACVKRCPHTSSDE